MSRTMKLVGLVGLIAATALSPVACAAVAVAEPAPQRPFRPSDNNNCLLFPGDPPTAGPRVVAGPQVLRESFAQGDLVYVEGEGTTALTVGEELQFVRSYGPFRHPITGEEVAHAIGLLGFAEIIDVDSARAMARITMSCREIEIGEYPLEPIVRAVPQVSDIPPFDREQLVVPDEADATIILGELESVISETGEERVSVATRETYGQADIVIIDQGGPTGWTPGDIATFYRAGLAVGASAASEPPMLLGNGVIVAVGAEVAALMIVETVFPVNLGDSVRRTGTARN